MYDTYMIDIHDTCMIDLTYTLGLTVRSDGDGGRNPCKHSENLQTANT